MALENILTVHKRDSFGKGPNRRLRAARLVPGVYYTAKGDNIPVVMETLPLEKMFAAMGRTEVFTLEIDDNGQKISCPAMFWSIQFHPYKKAFTHVDFYGVDLEKPVKIKVPLEFIGVSRGVKMGGRMENYREYVQLMGKPLDMPKKISIDVTDLDLNKTIYVGDLQLPEGVSACYDSNYAIVSVISKTADADSEEAAE